MPKVSIIIANYNNARYLPACLNSLSNQTFRDFEALVFDDKSTDNSIEVISLFSDKDSRFRLIPLPENKGVAYLRHIALSYCKGEYIAILDADDVSYPDRLLHQTQYLANHLQTVLIGGLNSLIDENGELIKYRKGMPITDIEHRWRLSFGNCIIHSTVMFRKEAALQIGGYNAEVKLSEDLDFYSRLLSVGKIESIPFLLSQLRLHKRSLTKKSKDEVQNYTLMIIRDYAMRILHQDISPDIARDLYFHKRKSCHSLESLQSVQNILSSYYEHYKLYALSNSELRILSKCYLRSLLLLKKRNSNKKWYLSLGKEMDIKIKKMLVMLGYSGMIEYQVLKWIDELTKHIVHSIKVIQFKQQEI